MKKPLEYIAKKFLQTLLREHARELADYDDLVALAKVARWARFFSNVSSVIAVMGLAMIAMIPYLALSAFINQSVPAAMVSVLLVFISAYLNAISAIADQTIGRRSGENTNGILKA
ncbi:hypothetical protein [Pseudomonas sp.]|uniref:hypothetical protein n=1 Tax=Pseudomonas sp. TaxID=306 RepID=UPI0039823728